MVQGAFVIQKARSSLRVQHLRDAEVSALRAVFQCNKTHTGVHPLTPWGNFLPPTPLIDPRLENVFLRQGHLWLLIRLSYGIIHQLLKKYIIFIIKNNITYVTEELKNRKKRNKNKL